MAALTPKLFDLSWRILQFSGEEVGKIVTSLSNHLQVAHEERERCVVGKADKRSCTPWRFKQHELSPFHQPPKKRQTIQNHPDIGPVRVWLTWSFITQTGRRGSKNLCPFVECFRCWQPQLSNISSTFQTWFQCPKLFSGSHQQMVPNFTKTHSTCDPSPRVAKQLWPEAESWGCKGFSWGI